jgi:AraC-like DNA-binding protein
MVFQRTPAAPLRVFIARLWANDDDCDGPAAGPALSERVLPTGLMHVVVRLTDRPLYVQDSSAPTRLAVPPCLVGGARSGFYARESAAPSSSVGAVLWPGAAALLFGAGADELAQRHTSLQDLWGSHADCLRAELCALRTAEARLARFEARLGERLPLVRGLHPEVAHLMRWVHMAPSVGAAVRESGLSHRAFIARFRRHVGLAPKTWLQVRRFQRALRAMRLDPAAPLADVAAAAGYSDQSHFGREFMALAGVTPAGYRMRSPSEANHLPVATQSGAGQFPSIAAAKWR